MSDATPVMDEQARRAAAEKSLRLGGPPAPVPGYEDLEFLGRGAFGEVWKARSTNTGRLVAIKFYTSRGGLDWPLLSREVDKLRVLSTNRHVVQVLEVGWESDPAYLVMEYMPGGSLEDLLRSLPGERLRPDDAVHLFQEVVQGLNTVHGSGILHCDLKPANILLDADGRPRLADFGQSRLSHEQTPAPALGTLFYMAPEQADLQAAPDARWDVYALGAVLFRMHTGHPPHFDKARATEITKTARLEARLAGYRQLLHDAPRPSEHRRVKGVDRDLADLVDRCLEFKPSKRFANVQAVLDALEHRTRLRNRRRLAAVGMLGPALILLGIAWFAWEGFRAATQESADAVLERALDSNNFAAQSVSRTVEHLMSVRWRVLQDEAKAPRFRELLFQALDAKPGDPARERLGLWLIARHQEHAPTASAYSWFVTAAAGPQRGRILARSPTPLPDGADKDYSDRNFFHGGPDGQHGLPPVRGWHRSTVYRSKSDPEGPAMVAFSVPVWKDAPDSEVVAVLSMTVRVGGFQKDLNFGKFNQETVLIDTEPDQNGKKGLILHHPRLEKEGSPGKLYYVDAAVVRVGEAARKQEAHQVLTDSDRAALRDFDDRLCRDYRDPVPGDGENRWVVGLDAVFVETPRGESKDTGWVVLIQEHYEGALRPVAELRGRLRYLGLWALGWFLVVMAILWAFVLWVLRDEPRKPLLQGLRQQLGLPGDQGSTNTPASGR
jgi:hypothetical protein